MLQLGVMINGLAEIRVIMPLDGQWADLLGANGRRLVVFLGRLVDGGDIKRMLRQSAKWLG